MKRFYPKYHSKEQVTEFNQLLRTTGFIFEPRQNIFYSLKNSRKIIKNQKEIIEKESGRFHLLSDYEIIDFEYDQKQWRVKVIKGQFGIVTGAQVVIFVMEDGEYHIPVNKEEEPLIRYHLWKGKKLLASREQKGYEASTLLIGEYANPQKLSMTIDLSFFESEMSEAFLEELLKKGNTGRELGIWGNTVRIRFTTFNDHRKVERNRTSFYKNLFVNRLNAAIFHVLTRKQICTIDKLQYIKLRHPILYQSIMKVFDTWGRIYG